eukprot:TRINITY_DN67892_c0_g1_i1.p1 TRINITY_DN67892_c0_g1~~TRINITY_DN67892_c0_g1_i1.p1  ORF type:complete len:137 (+),score=1.70 TRINITY_DN67892_c0_g1_i1:254-664(+)
MGCTLCNHAWCSATTASLLLKRRKIISHSLEHDSPFIFCCFNFRLQPPLVNRKPWKFCTDRTSGPPSHPSPYLPRSPSITFFAKPVAFHFSKSFMNSWLQWFLGWIGKQTILARHYVAVGTPLCEEHGFLVCPRLV